MHDSVMDLDRQTHGEHNAPLWWINALKVSLPCVWAMQTASAIAPEVGLRCSELLSA